MAPAKARAIPTSKRSSVCRWAVSGTVEPLSALCLLSCRGINLPSGAAEACTSAQEPQLGNSKRTFVKIGVSNGQAESKLGKLTAARADSREVRDFAKQMGQDYMQANLELLKTLRCRRPAKQYFLRLGAYQEAAKRLSQLGGAELDNG